MKPTAYDSFSPGDESICAQLKWRRVDNLMRVVYLGNKPPPDGLGENQWEDRLEKEKLVAKPETSQLILWGVRTDTKNEWIEQIVPHRFSYPMHKCEIPRGRLAIEMETWRDSAGRSRFSRYIGINETEG